MCLKTYPYIVINVRFLCDPYPNLFSEKHILVETVKREGGAHIFPGDKSDEENEIKKGKR